MRHYYAWYGALLNALHAYGWRVSPGDARPTLRVTIVGHDQRYELAWSFDAELERYILTVSSLLESDKRVQPGAMRRRKVGRRWRVERFVRMLVPSPIEGVDSTVVDALLAHLSGTSPLWCEQDAQRWDLSAAEGRLPDERWSNFECRASNARFCLRTVIGAGKGWDAQGNGGEDVLSERFQARVLNLNRKLTLGSFDVDAQGRLRFGVDVLHGALSDDVRRGLVSEVVERARRWRFS